MFKTFLLILHIVAITVFILNEVINSANIKYYKIFYNISRILIELCIIFDMLSLLFKILFW